MARFAFSYMLILIIGSLSAPTIADDLNINYTDMEGGTDNLSDFIGKPLLIDAFATWCEPCKVEMAHLTEIYTQAKNTLNLVSLSISPNSDTPVKIQQFRNSFGAQWTFGIDSDNRFVDKYKTFIIPTLYLFNAEGNLMKTWEGVVDAVDIAKGLKDEVGIDLDNIDYDGLDAIRDQISRNNLFHLTFSFMILSVMYVILVPNKQVAP